MSSTMPSTLRSKLQVLVPLLASDQIGEVAAAAAAIGRALKGDGLDFHDLARHIGAAAAPAPHLTHRAYHEEADRGCSLSWHPSRRYVVGDVLKAGIEDHAFTPWEDEFAHSILVLIAQPRPRLSEKQTAMINKLISKVMEARA